MHVVGDVPSGGDQMHLDIAGSLAGSNQKVSMRVQGKGTIEVLTIDGTHWVKAVDAQGAQQLGAPADAVGKSLLMPASAAAKYDALSLTALLSGMTAPAGLAWVTNADSVVDDVTEADRAAWRIRDRVGGQGEASTGEEGNDREVIVSADDEREMLKLTSPKDGTVTFSQWNGVAPFSSPPAAENATP